MGSIPERTPPLERHDMGRRLDWVCFISAIPAHGAEKRNFTFTFRKFVEKKLNFMLPSNTEKPKPVIIVV